jgi:hypothetical protein
MARHEILGGMVPFFGDMGLSEVNEDTAQAYRVYRLSAEIKSNKAVCNSIGHSVASLPM